MSAPVTIVEIAGRLLQEWKDLAPGGRDHADAIVAGDVTDVYDVDGSVAFVRCSLRQRGENRGYVDLTGVSSEQGAELLALALESPWDPGSLVRAAREKVASLVHMIDDDLDYRVLAYNYPILGVQVRRAGEELFMLDEMGWNQVQWSPLTTLESNTAAPESPARWSLRAILAPPRARSDEETLPWRAQRVASEISDADSAALIATPSDEELVLSCAARLGTGEPCVPQRCQETKAWCVPASVQMVLEYFCLPRAQQDVADALGLRTTSEPRGLDNGETHRIIDAIERLSSAFLTAQEIDCPQLDFFLGEIDDGRPVVSMLSGHTRVVAGYRLGRFQRFLFSLDPWRGPVWEDFRHVNYFKAFRTEVASRPAT